MKAISATGIRKYEPKASDVDFNVEAVEDRAAAIENTFLNNLGGGVKDRIGNISPISSVRSAISENNTPKKYNSEELLVSLYEVYDDMVAQFEHMDYTTSIAKKTSDNIIKLGHCIKKVGGEVEEFSPLDHVSGLSTPPMIKNAQQVIERTETCYTRATIKEMTTDNDGKTINITIAGKDINVGRAYLVKGTLTANKAWNGAEAIDYIYTPSSGGKMSVKVLEGTRWIDKSSDYKVGWELQEVDLDSTSPEDIDFLNKYNKKEGEKINTENKIAEDNYNSTDSKDEDEDMGDMGDLDFPIEDK